MSETPAGARPPFPSRSGPGGLFAPPAVFFAVLLIGVAAVAVAHPVFLHSVTAGLSDEYDEIALNLLRHGRFSASLDDPSLETIMRGPVYPLYLAGLFRLFGSESLRVVGFADMALHALSAALLVVALRMYVRPGVAAAGGLLFALWPTTFYYAGKGSSETMLTLWMAATFLLLLRLVRAPAWSTAFALGVAAGLACLTRGSAVALLVIAVVWLGVQALRRRARFGLLPVMLAAWALTMAPWWVRNARVAGEFVPFHSLVWYNAYHDDRFDEARRWLAATGRTRVDWSDLPADAYPAYVTAHPHGFAYPAALDARADLAQEARYRRIMLGKFRSPSYLLPKIGRNAIDFWAASASIRKTRALLATSVAWLLLLAWGAWRAWPERRWRAALIAALAVVGLTWGLYLPFLAIFRHSIPTAPFVAFAVALGMERWRAARAA